MTNEYDEAYRQTDLFGKDPSPLLAAHRDLLPAGARVLDIGVGQGRNALPLARAGCRVTGLDNSRRALELTDTAARGAGLTLNLVRQDVMAYEPAELFDAVLCFGLLQMLSRPRVGALVDRLQAWTRPGGALFLTAWHVGDPGLEKIQQTWKHQGCNSFSSPDGRRHRHFLAPGEILTLFPGWGVVHHQEGLGSVHRHGKGPEEQHGEVDVVLIGPAAAG